METLSRPHLNLDGPTYGEQAHCHQPLENQVLLLPFWMGASHVQRDARMLARLASSTWPSLDTACGIHTFHSSHIPLLVVLPAFSTRYLDWPAGQPKRCYDVVDPSASLDQARGGSVVDRDDVSAQARTSLPPPYRVDASEIAED